MKLSSKRAAWSSSARSPWTRLGHCCVGVWQWEPIQGKKQASTRHKSWVGHKWGHAQLGSEGLQALGRCLGSPISYFVPGLPGKLLTSVSPSHHLRMEQCSILKYFAFQLKGIMPYRLFAGEFTQDPLPLSRSEGSWGAGTAVQLFLSLEMSWEGVEHGNCPVCPEGEWAATTESQLRLTVWPWVKPLQGNENLQMPWRWLALPLAELALVWNRSSHVQLHLLSVDSQKRKNKSFQVVYTDKSFQAIEQQWNDGTGSWFTWCGSSGELCSHFMNLHALRLQSRNK